MRKDKGILVIVSGPSGAGKSTVIGLVAKRRRDIRERKLWRLDTLRGKTYLLLLSPLCPNPRHAVGQFGMGRSWESRDYAPLLASIREGEVCRFRLTANPTISRAQPRDAGGTKPRGTRFAHITVAHQRQ